LLSFKKEVLTYDIYLSICVYEPSEHYTKWNKPVTKRQVLYDFTYMKYLK
jgi:hypothetical protein